MHLRRLSSCLACSLLFAAPLCHAQNPQGYQGSQGQHKQAFSVVNLIHASPSTVEGVLGTPYRSRPDRENSNELGCSYRNNGNEYFVDFIDSKAVSVWLKLGGTYKTPKAGLAAVGIDMGKRKPAKESSINLTWGGNLSPSGAKRIVIYNFNDGNWNRIIVLDTLNFRPT